MQDIACVPAARCSYCGTANRQLLLPPTPPAVLTLCGKDCVNLKTNSTHCGTCQTRCPPGSACVGGACTPTAAAMPVATGAKPAAGVKPAATSAKPAAAGGMPAATGAKPAAAGAKPAAAGAKPAATGAKPAADATPATTGAKPVAAAAAAAVPTEFTCPNNCEWHPPRSNLTCPTDTACRPSRTFRGAGANPRPPNRCLPQGVCVPHSAPTLRATPRTAAPARTRAGQPAAMSPPVLAGSAAPCLLRLPLIQVSRDVVTDVPQQGLGATGGELPPPLHHHGSADWICPTSDKKTRAVFDLSTSNNNW